MTTTRTFPTHAGDVRYRQIDGAPAGLRWDTPCEYQGQICEWSFADVGDPAEAGVTSKFAREIDHSDGTVTFWRRVGGQWAHVVR